MIWIVPSNRLILELPISLHFIESFKYERLYISEGIWNLEGDNKELGHSNISLREVFSSVFLVLLHNNSSLIPPLESLLIRSILCKFL